MKAVDRLNSQYGRNVVGSGTVGVGARWNMQQNMKSPSFTTNFNEIPLAAIL
jgi:hypothetical protein